MWRLHVVLGGREQAVYDCPDGREMVVGRDPSVDIVVPERSVSRRHCRVIGRDGGVEVVDLGSANGIYAAGRAVRRSLLEEGDEAQVGMAHLKVSRAASRTGLVAIQGIADLDVTAAVDDPSTSSFTDTERSVLDADKNEYKSLEKERLALLIEAGKSLSQPLEINALFERIMDHLFEILEVRRAVIALENDGGLLEARCVRPRTDHQELSEIASQSIMRQVMESQKPQIIDDAQLDTGFNMAQSILAANIKAAICAPLISKDRVIGALYADYPGRAQLYRRSDLDFFGAFGSLCAVALDNARMQAERDLDRHDAEFAAEIQLELLPDDDMEVPGFELDWAYVPSKHVGGDFYDCTVVDENHIVLVIGDVSGKSIGAALFMARLMSFLRATIPEDPSPGSVLTRTNALLGTRASRTMFSTAFYMLVSRSQGTIRYASAGHNPVLLLTPGADTCIELGATGIPLCVDSDWKYTGEDVPAPHGSLLVLYTDGLVEARCPDGEQFGLQRVKELVVEHRARSVKEISSILNTQVDTWCRGSTYMRDDVALVVVRVSVGD